MKRAAIAICCALASVPCLAGDWGLAGSMDGYEQFVDYSSIEKMGHVRGAWLLSVFNHDSNGDAYSMTWVECDCYRSMYRGLEYAFYNKEGALSVSGRRSGQWAPIRPGGLDDSTCRAVCSKTPEILFPSATPRWLATKIRDTFVANGVWK